MTLLKKKTGLPYLLKKNSSNTVSQKINFVVVWEPSCLIRNREIETFLEKPITSKYLLNQVVHLVEKRSILNQFKGNILL